jgi:endonuclease III
MLPRLKQRVPLLLAELEKRYPETGTALNFQNPLQLAIATILSAQCTDKRVNIVTPDLFQRFPTAQSFADAELSQIEELIKTTGFFRNKAKHIRGFCEAILQHHHGEVPSDLDVLVELPGIGRKTANVVLGDGFGIPGITVDTHVGRLSRRLGLTKLSDPVKVEFALQKLIPQEEWTRFSHRLILLGREVCDARKPKCAECPLTNLCPKRGLKKRKKKRSTSRDPKQ